MEDPLTNNPKIEGLIADADGTGKQIATESSCFRTAPVALLQVY
jgi:hypothetical protein